MARIRRCGHAPPTYREYLALLGGADRDLRGEASTSYLYSEAATAGLARSDPDAKIIVMIRNLIDMIRSLHDRFRSSGIEPLSLRAALAAESIRAFQRTREDALDPRLRYRLLTDLESQIARYHAAFPRQNVEVVVQEELKGAPQRVLSDVVEFLGVDSSFTPEVRPVNPHKTTRSRFVRRLIHLPPATVRTAIAAGVPRLVSKFHALNTEMHAPAAIEPSLRVYLRDLYGPDVEALCATLDRDLTEWRGDWSIDEFEQRQTEHVRLNTA